MSFTFPLKGVTQIAMVRKIPREKKISVTINEVQLMYTLAQPGAVTLLPGEHPDQDPELLEKIQQILEHYYVTAA